jgi:hypothetical protein
MATKQAMKTNFFHPSLFFCFWIWGPGCEIRYWGWVKIRIRDRGSGSATLFIHRVAILLLLFL